MCLFLQDFPTPVYDICQSRTAISDRWWWIIERFSLSDSPVNHTLNPIGVQPGKIWDAPDPSFVTPEKPGQDPLKPPRWISVNLLCKIYCTVRWSRSADLHVWVCKSWIDTGVIDPGIKGSLGEARREVGAEAPGFFFGTFVIPDRLINTDWMKSDWVNPVCLVWPKSQQCDGGCGKSVRCVVCWGFRCQRVFKGYSSGRESRALEYSGPKIVPSFCVDI